MRRSRRDQTPPVALTTEQRVREATDHVADWVFVVCGYDLMALMDLEATIHGDALQGVGVTPGHVSGLYSLSHSTTAEDVA